MAKMFLTGGNNGMWKRRKLSTVAPTYVDFVLEVHLDPDTQEVTSTISTDFNFDVALDILKNNGTLIGKAKYSTSDVYFLFSDVVAYDLEHGMIVFACPPYDLDPEGTSYESISIYWTKENVIFKSH